MDKTKFLLSLLGNNTTTLTGTITIRSNNVTVEGLNIIAPVGYTAQPVIHMIGIKDVNILNNKVTANYLITGQPAIGTSQGPAEVTGIIKGNTVIGAIGVGTNGKLEVTSNTVTGAMTEGIWFYPLGTTAELTIKGNTITGQGATSSQILVVSKPTSINGKTTDAAMYNTIFSSNKSISSVKLGWVVD
jgi:hypothetical protein